MWLFDDGKEKVLEGSNRFVFIWFAANALYELIIADQIQYPLYQPFKTSHTNELEWWDLLTLLARNVVAMCDPNYPAPQLTALSEEALAYPFYMHLVKCHVALDELYEDSWFGEWDGPYCKDLSSPEDPYSADIRERSLMINDDLAFVDAMQSMTLQELIDGIGLEEDDYIFNQELRVELDYWDSQIDYLMEPFFGDRDWEIAGPITTDDRKAETAIAVLRDIPEDYFDTTFHRARIKTDLSLLKPASEFIVQTLQQGIPDGVTKYRNLLIRDTRSQLDWWSTHDVDATIQSFKAEMEASMPPSLGR